MEQECPSWFGHCASGGGTESKPSSSNQNDGALEAVEEGRLRVQHLNNHDAHVDNCTSEVQDGHADASQSRAREHPSHVRAWTWDGRDWARQAHQVRSNQRVLGQCLG
ncbi:uncharacterized protein B0I36DRAFT_359077 [Microdochium trichocladiopsis]|uniref:Uncharacterized protein n=1 Tax=Microdochium trichocladiopsis TaxID=1682393 RepID=A0A9P8YB08_9PEZI|nr:uncharacterized protein B0I36DRAFT_359077 [Microdochium trichocladiopsis]KAH7037366.1 hypothetical protein B0I36DRAFT_359077 [Microdochium trichocladiopsis]